MSNCKWNVTAGLIAILIAGCNQPSGGPSPKATTSVSETVSDASFLLADQPVDAKPVGDVRESAEDGADVAILGRIGGGENPWVDGRAAFTIVDPKLEPCKPEEGCPTPWDYCCSTDLLPKNRALVKFVTTEGDTMEQDARKLLGVKELQTVVVKGKAKRDEAGNLTVHAEGLFVVPETK